MESSFMLEKTFIELLNLWKVNYFSKYGSVMKKN